MGKAFLIFFGDRSKEQIKREIEKLDEKIIKTETELAHYKAAKTELEDVLAQKA